MNNNKKNKILLIISTLSDGGAQRAFANMSLGFPSTLECDFLLNDSSEITYPYNGNIISLNIKPQKDKTSLLYQLVVFIKRYIVIKKLKKTGRYLACISALTSANAVNVLTGNHYCKTITSIRIFISQVIQRNHDLKSIIKYWSIKYLSNKADYVISVSESMRQDLIKNFGVKEEKAFTIYNGYPLEQIRSLAQEPLSPVENSWFKPGKIYFITIGRLEPQKGHSYLIRAFKKVHSLYPNTVLLLLGEGSIKKDLMQLINDLHLKDDVIICGFLQNPYKILSKCHLFILSSMFEGFPNTLAESLCLGVPVISTDCDSGAREILAPQTNINQKVITGYEIAEYGILCPVCNSKINFADEPLTEAENCLADAVIYMLQDTNIYELYKKKSQERAYQLNVKSTTNMWLELISSSKY